MIRCAGVKGRGLWLTWCILICGIAPGLGSEPYRPVPADPLLEPWRWSTFPELSGRAAQCVTEGKDGTMWFGTAAGLWSYDGIEWTAHSLDAIGVGGGIVSLCQAGDYSLYAGTRFGIGQFRNGQWTRLFPPRNQDFGDVRKLAIGPDGALWAATSWGALRFQNSQWTLYTTQEIAGRLGANQGANVVSVELLPESLAAKARTNSLPARRHDLSEVCVDPKNRIWLGTDGGEILCYQPETSGDSTNAPATSLKGKWTLYNERDGMVCGRVPYILPLRDGQVWVVYAAGSGHLNVFDGNRWQTTRLLDAGVSEDCSNPLQTRDGVVWLSTRYVVYALRDGRWRAYQKPEVPIPTARNFLFQSADGALWIGGSGTEIQRVDYQTPRWLTLRDLNFHWESPTGAEWFLHRSGRVVVHEADQWISYGVEDGVIDAPVALVGTRSGEVWVAGSHQQVAATARFDGQKWTRFVHDELSWGIDWRGVLAASDGSVWFAAAVDSSGPREHRAGLLQFRNGEWLHHHQPGRAPRNGDDGNPATLLPATQRPEPIGKFLCLGESPDGKVWAGRNILAFQDGSRWRLFASSNVSFGIIETLFTGQGRELWIGTRQFGALRYDGREWRQFQGKESLVANSVRSVAQTADGSIWAATDRGFSRFDEQTWTADTLPEHLLIPHEGGSLKAAGFGCLWINRFAPEWNRRAWSKGGRVDAANCEFWTVRHRFQGTPPKTTITSGSKTVAYPGSVSVFWNGTAAWREPKEAQLQFSHRMDGGPWSPFVTELGHAFFNLPSGEHLLEVRARDRDFNVDLTPATLSFVVLPPVWRQGWFITLVLLLVGAAFVQSLRVVRERGLLRTTNQKLAAEVEDRTQAEAALRKSEGLYRSFIAASPDGIVVVDPRGVVRFASLRIYELLGRDSEHDLTGTNALEWIVPEDRERALANLEAIANGEVVNHAEFAIVRQGGNRLYVDMSGAPLLGPGGQPTGIVTMVRDATARRRAEEEIRNLTGDLEKRVQERTAELRKASDELKDSQRALMNLVEDLNEKTAAVEAVNKELEAFSYSVSHDLRAPLRGIDGFSQALVEDHGDKLDDEGRHYLQRIRAGAQRMAQLIDDMLNLSRVTRGEMRMERVHLSGLVQEIANDLMRREPGRKVRFVIAPDVAVTGDARFLRVALENVLSNAWKFTSRRPEATIEFGVTSEDGQRVYFVRDNGAGFNMQYAGKLFGAFQRLHTVDQFPGTGVGLATVQRIIHRHGGRVWAEGENDRGATFFFSLPPRG